MTVQALDDTPAAPRILVIGTGDTKADEIQFLANTITKANAVPLLMDVSVLGDPPYIPDFSKHDVAAAAGHTLEHILESPDENVAMTLMAEGASALALSLHDAGQIHGLIALGGTMGTDLALEGIEGGLGGNLGSRGEGGGRGDEGGGDGRLHC